MKVLIVFLLLISLSACGTNYPILEQSIDKISNKDEILYPSNGNYFFSNALGILDCSNKDKGYVMFKTYNSEHNKLKMRIIKDDYVYTYDVPKDDMYITYPLNLGNGLYTIKLFENVEADNYAIIDSYEIEVNLENEYGPFLYPNVIVDYDINTKAIEKSYELCAGINTDIERVYKVFDWIIHNVKYDYKKAEEVSGKYVLPIIDETLENKTGICFDYAALMACMLRVHQIPVKLVTGYVDRGYHAWVEVYVNDIGWINPSIYFNGEYTRLDPTYESMGGYKGPYEDLYKY